jgi:hypothetical protein
VSNGVPSLQKKNVRKCGFVDESDSRHAADQRSAASSDTTLEIRVAGITAAGTEPRA